MCKLEAMAHIHYVADTWNSVTLYGIVVWETAVNIKKFTFVTKSKEKSEKD